MGCCNGGVVVNNCNGDFAVCRQVGCRYCIAHGQGRGDGDKLCRFLLCVVLRSGSHLWLVALLREHFVLRLGPESTALVTTALTPRLVLLHSSDVSENTMYLIEFGLVSKSMVRPHYIGVTRRANSIVVPTVFSPA